MQLFVFLRSSSAVYFLLLLIRPFGHNWGERIQNYSVRNLIGFGQRERNVSSLRSSCYGIHRDNLL